MRMACMLIIALVMPNVGAGAGNDAEQVGKSESVVPNQDSANTLQSSSALDQFDGIVIDQTITRPGKDFYQLFATNWRDQPLSERYTVSVREQPSARFGSQVFIVFGNRRIFQGQISPNRHQIRMLSEAAVEVAYKAVTEGEMQRLLFKDPDIGQDEI